MSSEPNPAGPRGLALRRLAPLAGLLALFVAVYATGWYRELSLETLVRHSETIDAFIAGHRAAAVVVFVTLYVLGVVLAVPASGALLAVVGGFLFGVLVGGFAAMVGSTIGAALVFLVARSTFGDHLLRKANPLIARLAAGFRADAFCYVLFLRLVPVPAWFTNVTAALLNVRLRTFVCATALGRTPGSLVLALFGAGLDSVIEAQATAYRACLAAGDLDCRIDFDPANVITPTLVAALLALGLLALVPVLARRVLSRRAAAEPERF